MVLYNQLKVKAIQQKNDSHIVGISNQ